MLKIIVTGPESSGKTTLCKSLSKHFKIPFISIYYSEVLPFLTLIPRDFLRGENMQGYNEPPSSDEISWYKCQKSKLEGHTCTLCCSKIGGCAPPRPRFSEIQV